MNKELLQLALMQWDLAWERPADNLQWVEDHLPAEGVCDVMILPETFTTGFSMDVSLAEKMPLAESEAVLAMKSWAMELDAAVCGSVMVQDLGKVYNRFLWVQPDGTIKEYNKRHLFGLAHESKHYHPGRERVVIEWRGWRILPMICYDLRFPVFSRSREDYDLAIYVANWPVPRIQAWDVLLKARAIENISYTAGVNRTGLDGNKIPHNGHSQVNNYLGDTLLYAGDEPGVYHTQINLHSLKVFRRAFPFLKDRDKFSIDYQ